MLSLPWISAGFLKAARVRLFALAAAAIALGQAPPAAGGQASMAIEARLSESTVS
jgi:hypothetical protein